MAPIAQLPQQLERLPLRGAIAPLESDAVVDGSLGFKMDTRMKCDLWVRYLSEL